MVAFLEPHFWIVFSWIIVKITNKSWRILSGIISKVAMLPLSTAPSHSSLQSNPSKPYIITIAESRPLHASRKYIRGTDMVGRKAKVRKQYLKGNYSQSSKETSNCVRSLQCPSLISSRYRKFKGKYKRPRYTSRRAWIFGGWISSHTRSYRKAWGQLYQDEVCLSEGYLSMQYHG